MKEKLSINSNIIRYNLDTREALLEDILMSRFSSEDDLEKTLEDLHDPYLLAGMKEAVDRIKQAKEKGEKVMIFWDYDVDWVTSTSILMHFFKKIWILASYRIPHRVNDGYGLKKYFIDELKDKDVSLIVTVDCGTRDIDIIKYAKQNNIDVIVTDHHSVPEVIPEEAIAVINPKRQDCPYPFKYLSWAWVAYKLMMALARDFLSEQDYHDYLKESIDIAAIGTVADCMSLTWENRIIVKEWLKQIKNTRSRWIYSLIEDKINQDLDADLFGFVIWPRLNAAGRMDTPYKAVNLILNNSDSIDETLAEIERLNDKRKHLTKVFFDDAMEKVDRSKNIIFYHSNKIEHWIIWIVAWKLTEKFNRPSIVLIDEGDKLVASCRSPEFFDIVWLLEKHSSIFVAFWWHKQAAGFTIEKSRFTEFKSIAYRELDWQSFSKNKKIIEVDKIVDLRELGFRFVNSMNRFKPFGIGNKKPVFMLKDFDSYKLRFLWKTRDHLRFDTDLGFKIFAFAFWEHYEKIKNSSKIDLVFDLSEDYFMWRKNLMLKVLDIVVKD